MFLNKKVLTLALVAVFICGNCFAQFSKSRFKITQSPKEFDVIYYVTQDMKLIENLENDDVSVTQSFLLSKDGMEAELRYSLFTDIGEGTDDLILQFSMWSFICLNNIAGYEVSTDTLSMYDPEDVAKEFNGTFGGTAFLANPKSGYSQNYKFMMIDFIYKENQGLVMRTFLFNNPDFLGISKDGNISSDSLWSLNFHSFRFMEKDENGEYITQ